MPFIDVYCMAGTPLVGVPAIAEIRRKHSWFTARTGSLAENNNVYEVFDVCSGAKHVNMTSGDEVVESLFVSFSPLPLTAYSFHIDKYLMLR